MHVSCDRRAFLLCTVITCCLVMARAVTGAEAPTPSPAERAWPPAFPGAVGGAVTMTSPEFLIVPAKVEQKRNDTGAAVFSVAKVPVTIDLAAHAGLHEAFPSSTGWSSWGDICVARDGKVYCGIGDHGRDVDGQGHVFIYCWDPAKKTLRKIVDANAVAGVAAGDPSFSKVHAGIFEGANRKIYFTCTLNNGGKAGEVKWTRGIPGGLIYEYDPESDKTAVIGKFDGEVTATSRLDFDRNMLFVCLEGKAKPPADAALGAFDIVEKRWVFKSEYAIHGDRNLMMDRDGNVYFNGLAGELWKFDRVSRTIGGTGIYFRDAEAKPNGLCRIRSSTSPTRDGIVYGTTMPGRLFRFDPARKEIKMLGPDFGTGDYTTVTVLSPDEKYVYYLPGAHGGAKDIGTPIVQYEIATGKRKVLSFLGDAVESKLGVRLSGTYGAKLSADGSTLYVNFNGHAREDLRVEKMKPNGFGFTTFVAVHIPASERE